MFIRLSVALEDSPAPQARGPIFCVRTPRSGRPPSFTALQIAEVKALACQLPAETGTPLSRWSCPEPAREVVARAIAGALSASTVRRRLKDDALKPWQYRSWIFVCDPESAPRPPA
jgi:hypothetical protein